METAAGIAAGRGGSLPMSSSASSPSRKEWRVVSEQTGRNADNELEKNVVQELERSKLGKSDKRSIYEQGTGHVDVHFSSNPTTNGVVVESELSQQQQRLHDIVRRREDLQQMEIELRAHFLIRSELMTMQNRFDAQIKEHVNAASKLKEQLHEREQTVCELELKMEEKERELRAVKIDNEAAWAKEGILREQNKELASFRRELDNSEAEREQHIQQIHDLNEHIREKERQLLELEEQHRVAQETIHYKDGQLREAQTWIARVQEMDSLQSTTNHSLQAELRERTEQFNQFWLGCQRQFNEMESHHMQAIQQLQLELAEARERSGVYTDEKRAVRSNTNDTSSFGQNIGLNEAAASIGNHGLMPNGNAGSFQPFASTDNRSTEADEGRVAGDSVVPSSLFSVGAYVPSGQVPALHPLLPFVIHQQAVPAAVPSANMHIPPSHMGHFQSVPAISSHSQWQNQQAVPDSSQAPSENHYQLSQRTQTEETLLGSGARYNYELSNGHNLQADHLAVSVSPTQEPGSVITASDREIQVLQSNEKSTLVSRQPQQNFEESADAALRMDSSDLNRETELQVENEKIATNHSSEVQGLIMEDRPSASISVSDVHAVPVNLGEATEGTSSILVSEASFSAERTTNLLPTKKIPEPMLLDERSLLACIVRAIPPGSSGSQIRISSTLPNRLGKMLAPLHWHDYKKKYGKLDDFVAGHPRLFVIDGDFIHLRDGAQEIISATAAVAKVAAAAAAVSAPYSASLPSVAVTPMAAQSHHLKRVPRIDPNHLRTGSTVAVTTEGGNKLSHSSFVQQNQYSNGDISSNIVHGLSNVTILSKPKEVGNGIQTGPNHSHVQMSIGNGSTPDKAVSPSLQTKGSGNWRNSASFAGQRQGRVVGSGPALTTRK